MAGGMSQRIEKLMSLTLAEFHKSIAVLAGRDLTAEGPDVRLAVEGGTAAIRFEPLPGATLGGLLQLPRARITIALDGLDDAQRTTFLKRFDLAFQRGGG